MNFVFRADASRDIGTGHVSRSSVLAETAIAQGHECIFVGKIEDSVWLSQKIRNMGFSMILSEKEAKDLVTEDSVLILDSYTIPTDNDFVRKEYWKYVVVIADLDTPKYQGDLVVHPALDEFRPHFKNQKVLWGADYLLLRNSLRNAKAERIENKLRSKVLVTGGGTDPYGFCKELYSLLKMSRTTNEIVFLTNDDELFQEAQKPSFPKNFDLIPLGGGFDIVVKNVKAAICPASTTSLEMVAMNIPTAVAKTAENQNEYYSKLTSEKICIPIGHYDSSIGWNLNHFAIKTFVNELNYNERLIGEARLKIDFNGAERIIKTVLEEINCEID